MLVLCKPGLQSNSHVENMASDPNFAVDMSHMFRGSSVIEFECDLSDSLSNKRFIFLRKNSNGTCWFAQSILFLKLKRMTEIQAK